MIHEIKPDPPPDWFKDWFDLNYLAVYNHRDQTEAEDFVNAWHIWNEDLPGNWCLDLGCGAGRYARAISARGLHVLGIDLSPALLREAAHHGRDNVYYVRADMRHIPAKTQFALVVSLFTSFGYFSDEENFQLLKEVYQLLSPGGYFVIDLPNPEMVRTSINEAPLTVKKINNIIIREERFINSGSSRVIKRIDIKTDHGAHRYFESVRLYARGEFETLLRDAGIRLHGEPCGDYKCSPFNPESPRLIFFGSRID